MLNYVLMVIQSGDEQSFSTVKKGMLELQEWTHGMDLWLGSVICLFCLYCCFTSQVNSYGHCGTVSSPNHTYFLGKLEQAVNQ